MISSSEFDSSKLPSFVDDQPKSNRWCTSGARKCVFLSVASLGCSVVVVLNPSDTVQIVSLMGASGSGWEALQSFFELYNAPQVIYISQEVVKMLAPFITFGGTEESLNVNDKTRALIFLIWTAYLSPLSILSIKNTFYETYAAFLELNSIPLLPSVNGNEISATWDNEGGVTCYSIHKIQKIFYSVITLSGVGFLIWSRYESDSLIKESLTSVGYRQFGFVLGHLGEELILQSQLKVDCEMRNNRNNPNLVVTKKMIFREYGFKVLTYIPKATPLFTAILFSFPTWWSHALVGLLSGCTVKYNRSLLAEKNSFREFALDSRVEKCFTGFKALYLITMFICLTEFDVPILKASKLDAENFGSFEPGVIIGVLGTVGSSILVKKRGLDSEIAKIAFSIFVLNAFLFGNFFFWVLNDPNIGMSNEDVSTTTILFSSMAWASLGLAFGTELGSCMTNELKPLLGKTYLPMSLFLLWRYTIEHLLGKE